jgi:HAD superfamily hydrolase (TIGR01549 family)
MFYKNIILDIDNTLYDYTICHKTSLNKIFNFISDLQKCDVELIKKSYFIIDKNHKILTINTASSHNKYIKFKQLLEKYNMNNFEEIHKLYWDTFYENIIPFKGVIDFLKWNKSLGINIGVLTDYETEFQVEKLKKLNLFQYIDYIVTSEEIGCEKPSIHTFNYILMKMDANRHETIMIGDSFEKDIVGAQEAKIYPYYYNNNEFTVNKYYTVFNSFLVLYEKFIEIHDEINNLKIISRYCGERFDLVQAGGGNISVKIKNLMFIKASGFSLTDIIQNKGYVCINNEELLNDLCKNKLKKITDYNMYGSLRGSIETYMHSILKKYTIHLHPIQVNKILILKNSKDIIQKLFPDSLIIDYITPGIKIYTEINNNYSGEEIIFLINHGLIINTDKYDNINNILDNIIDTCQSYHNFDSSNYKLTNKISNYIFENYKINIISYLSQDILIKKYLKNNINLFQEKITFPDALIYCGIKPIICSINNINNIKIYFNKYNEIPKIIIIENNLIILSHSLKKCKEIEDVLKANLLILDTTQEKQYLSSDEICFLNNWEAEKYRKLI